MVRTNVLLLPPLSQPRLPVLPPSVCTETLYAPGPEIMLEVRVTVSLVTLLTVVGAAGVLGIVASFAGLFLVIILIAVKTRREEKKRAAEPR